MKESRTTALVHFSSVVGRHPTPGASSKLRQEWPVYSFQMPPDPIVFQQRGPGASRWRGNRRPRR